MSLGAIVLDRDIPFVGDVFDPFFEVRRMAGDAVSQADVCDAVALVVRTRTRCDASLLGGSRLRLVATATIGTDHIDTGYCASRGIAVVSAPGCNAAGVAQYVSAALHALSLDKAGSVLGVIGVGHVGSLVAEAGRRAGMHVLLNDPPRESAEGPGCFTPLDSLLAASDVVTLHIPLWPENRDFADADFFASMRGGASFINTSRGEAVDEDALLDARSRLNRVVIDVWKHEPVVNRALLETADIATPHIAGYSVQGKINGTQAVVRAVGDVFGIDELRCFSVKDVVLPRLPYDIMADDAALRGNPSAFESLRRHYSYRNDQLRMATHSISTSHPGRQTGA